LAKKRKTTPLATGYWPLAAGLLSLAACLWVGQQQEASGQ